MLKWLATTLLIIMNVTNACAEKLQVVVSFPILQDIVKQVAGEQADVTSIVGNNVDPHLYEVKPGDAKIILKSKAVFLIGLGFEGWFDRLLDHVEYKGKVVIVTKNTTPRTLVEAEESSVDPHAWGDVQNIIKFVKEIVTGLSEVDPDNKSTYEANGKSYTQQLAELHKWVTEQFKPIPKDKRKVITTHDAFWYYGAAYGIDFLAPVGTSTEAEPSAQDIVKIINTIKREKINAIFFENLANKKHIEQIAAETGVVINLEEDILYADTLPPGKSYVEMVQDNTKLIVAKLMHGLSKQ